MPYRAGIPLKRDPYMSRGGALIFWNIGFARAGEILRPATGRIQNDRMRIVAEQRRTTSRLYYNIRFHPGFIPRGAESVERFRLCVTDIYRYTIALFFGKIEPTDEKLLPERIYGLFTRFP